ncbi:hypothetical protein, partial [Arthrobacter cryoconiti]|uniref:hypothetical protein n=1 Tax=Arthrobacter cryoconiti TaxID=748907 RepID=UPI001E3D4FCF
PLHNNTPTPTRHTPHLITLLTQAEDASPAQNTGPNRSHHSDFRIHDRLQELVEPGGINGGRPKGSGRARRPEY